MVSIALLTLGSGCESSGSGSTEGSGGEGGQSTTPTTEGGGGGDTPTGNGAGGPGEGGAGNGGVGNGGTTSGSGGSGGGQSAVPQCWVACTTAADCAIDQPVYDEDNYACTAGRCDYKGCLSDEECTDTFQSPGWACAAIPGSPVKGCVETCATVADCAIPQPILDEDNYACTEGKCDYKGCLSTQECTDTFKTDDYECAAVPGSPVKSCVQKCTSAADCATGEPAFGEDNYACNAGVCEYKGCNSTEECTETYMGPGYVCE
jgi:hypothetical protein